MGWYAIFAGLVVGLSLLAVGIILETRPDPALLAQSLISSPTTEGGYSQDVEACALIADNAARADCEYRWWHTPGTAAPRSSSPASPTAAATATIVPTGAVTASSPEGPRIQGVESCAHITNNAARADCEYKWWHTMPTATRRPSATPKANRADQQGPLIATPAPRIGTSGANDPWAFLSETDWSASPDCRPRIVSGTATPTKDSSIGNPGDVWATVSSELGGAPSSSCQFTPEQKLEIERALARLRSCAPSYYDFATRHVTEIWPDKGNRAHPYAWEDGPLFLGLDYFDRRFGPRVEEFQIALAVVHEAFHISDRETSGYIQRERAAYAFTLPIFSLCASTIPPDELADFEWIRENEVERSVNPLTAP